MSVISFYLGLIKQAPFHSGISRNEDMSNQNFKNSEDNTSRRHWGNAIRKLFFNSNGVSLMIEEGSNPILFSLNDPHHDGLCIGTRYSHTKILSKKCISYPSYKYSLNVLC